MNHTINVHLKFSSIPFPVTCLLNTRLLLTNAVVIIRYIIQQDPAIKSPKAKLVARSIFFSGSLVFY